MSLVGWLNRVTKEVSTLVQSGRRLFSRGKRASAPPMPACSRVKAPATRPSTELEVVNHVTRLIGDLELSFGPISQIATEVRSHGRSRADILLLGNDLISIEAKLSDWRRAFGQAVLNTTVVDRSYIAMWSGYIGRALIDAAERHGIGVIEVHPEGLEIVVKATAGQPDSVAREAVLTRLSQRSIDDLGGGLT